MGRVYSAYNVERMNKAIAEEKRLGIAKPSIIRVMEAIRDLAVAVKECDNDLDAGHLRVSYNAGGDESGSASISHLGLSIAEIYDNITHDKQWKKEQAIDRKSAVKATRAKK